VHSFANTSNFQTGFDAKGRLWASLGGVNKLVALNPQTGTVETFPAPPTKGDSAFSSGLYGGVMSSDGKHVWFTQLQGHLFSFNTETEKIETALEFPRGSGPRRLAIDHNDVIYLPLFGAGELYVYDTRANKEIGRYPLPDRAAAPYAVTWDPGRNAVWFGSGNSNRIYRFDVDSKQFVEYPLPSGEGTIVRAIAVDAETGNIYFSYAPVAQLKRPHMVVEIVPGEPEQAEQTAALP
jgi:streptogramin lyase